MLSRTAENLFWMGRYIERAENMARLLDVSYRTSLLPTRAGQDDALTEWTAILAILGARADFEARYGTPTQDKVITYLTLDATTPFSIVANVRAARENARALRPSISSEMWEGLNSAWLELKVVNPETLARRGLREFFDWVKERSHLFRGTSYATVLHNDAFHFLRLGTFLERADSTARLLATKYHILATSRGNRPIGETFDGRDTAETYYEWGAVLQAVSALRAYHQIYRDAITPERVAELLLLRPDMPRSLRFSFDHITQQLDALAGGRSLDSQRRAGEFHARLRFARIEHLIERDLHLFLKEGIDNIKQLGADVSHDFMMSV